MLETHCKAWRCPGRGSRSLSALLLWEHRRLTQPVQPARHLVWLNRLPLPCQSTRAGWGEREEQSTLLHTQGGVGGVYKHLGNPESRPGVSGPRGLVGGTGLAPALFLSLGPSPPHPDSGSIKLEEDSLLDSRRP